ncbi:MAG: tetratricopeptide repeat protein [Gemmatimonadetes bacterium]|nr:tetratricopeptide repeat protein [Gemmatimonadota bacterium]
MANVAALKKKAAEFELKKQLDKAVAIYQEILAAYDTGDEDTPDVGLYNRVGDLLVRLGNVPEAVAVYERAVDLYENGGFFNNAIALCNKILRTSPGRAVVYYKLGKISAAKGFKGDAKQNFLEYADRMRKAGDIAESFRALKEFATLCPDQDDFRLMLAEQLSAAGRTSEAVEQLQQLYARHVSLGRTADAEAIATRLRTIDPSAAIVSESNGRAEKRQDLVFLDLDGAAVAETPAVLGLERTSLNVEVPEPPAELVFDTLPMVDVEASEPIVFDTPRAEAAEVTEFTEPVLEPDDRQQPAPPRRSSVVLADSVALLSASLESNPEDHGLRREYAEALLDRGDRDEGIAELQTSLEGFERDNDLATARSVIAEILRLLPDSVRHHQKRVELAFRANDTQSLMEGYLALADALMRDGQPQKAQVVYQRVLEIAPDDARAREALEAFGPTPSTLGTPRGRRYTLETGVEGPSLLDVDTAASTPAEGSDADYVSLGDWLREDEELKSTRMVVGEEKPSGDEQADFADMLRSKRRCGALRNGCERSKCWGSVS